MFSRIILTAILSLPLTVWASDDPQTIEDSLTTPSHPQESSQLPENNNWVQPVQFVYSAAQEFWNNEEDKDQQFAMELTMAIFYSSGSCTLM